MNFKYDSIKNCHVYVLLYENKEKMLKALRTGIRSGDRAYIELFCIKMTIFNDLKLFKKI